MFMFYMLFLLLPFLSIKLKVLSQLAYIYLLLYHLNNVKYVNIFCEVFCNFHDKQISMIRYLIVLFSSWPVFAATILSRFFHVNAPRLK